MKIYDLLLIQLSVLIKFSTGIVHDDYMSPVLQIMHVMQWRFTWVGCVDNSSRLKTWEHNYTEV